MTLVLFHHSLAFDITLGIIGSIFFLLFAAYRFCQQNHSPSLERLAILLGRELRHPATLIGVTFTASIFLALRLVSVTLVATELLLLAIAFQIPQCHQFLIWFIKGDQEQ